METIKLVCFDFLETFLEPGDDVEARLRFCLNGESEDIFVGGNALPIKAAEKAFRQMLIKWKLLVGDIDDSVFDYPRLGVINPAGENINQQHMIRLIRRSNNGVPDRQVVHVIELSPNRAAIVALTKAYSEELGISFELPWEPFEESMERMHSLPQTD